MRTKWLQLVACIAAPLIPCFAHASEREHESLRCPNSDSKFAQIKGRAEGNDTRAQTILASCYDLGRHVAPSRKENIHWLTLAANQGYAPAESQLGHIYLYGSGIPSDYRQAFIWEQKAAQQGDAQAQRDLAFMYEQGFGVAADPQEAMFWNRKSAEQGERTAQLQLAKALEPSDRDEAMRWYRAAGRQQLPEAQLRLAQMYFEGAGGNCKDAIKWYERASENGVAQAMYELGKIYQSEQCGVPSAREAYVWFETGARYGSKEARAAADALAPGFTDAQKQAFARRIDAWAKKHTGADKYEDEEEREER